MLLVFRLSSRRMDDKTIMVSKLFGSVVRSVASSAQVPDDNALSDPYTAQHGRQFSFGFTQRATVSRNEFLIV